ncbi:hypothetical protein H072_6981 [Dactylellina haptotyla CBS 200.50]|uniref:Uncharacterized protein n=1 Tax=Dactylellina haptotyla (strain CBS 200.50) TaxID=1284197 RepID=S8A871_DACHA|nr:hypothetical protein H072_6981 [Dactylellina haptotyla CBS 200.50]
MAKLVWFITGCSSGIGEQLVHIILARGDKVIATARNPDSILPLESLGASTLQLDVTSDEPTIAAVIAQAVSIYGRIDVLVNNAGYVQIGNWEDLAPETWQSQFATNFFGPIKITRGVLPYFRRQQSGTLVFVSSLSGWIGHPGCGAYASSKFALEGAVESLRGETSRFGIKTLLIEPGRFRTMLLSGEKMKAATSSVGDYQGTYEKQLEYLAKEDRAQPGDPVKLVNIIVDLVRGEGVAEGKEVPFRVPIGTDCYEEVRGKCEQTLSVLGDWETVIKSTDYDG